MALPPDRTPPPARDAIIARDEDRIVREDMAPDAGRSNVAAFLLGGMVVAGGMLAFLYYDSGDVGRGRDITTGSLGRIETRPMPPAPNVLIPPQPSTPPDAR